jgi:N-formylmaleamate deformylase
MPMIDWEQGFVASHGAQLKYYRSAMGSDKPSVVLVHGFTDSALYFTRLAEHLANSWDVVAYDARGHGESTRLAASGGVFDDSSRVEDLRQVINSLSLDRPLLIGHSMGAATIALAVADDATLSCGAVLEDPAWWEYDDSQLAARRTGRAALLAGWRQWVTAIQAMTEDEAISMRTQEEPNWHPVDIKTSLYARRHFDTDLFEPFLPERSPWRALVAAFQQPVLLMLGSAPERGAIITTEVADEARSMNQLLHWAQIDGAGHHLRYDRFDAFVDAVEGFISDNKLRR